MNDKLHRAVDKQINLELYSAYSYLGFSARFDQMGLKGFAHWLRVQWQEEISHAMKLYDHLLSRDLTVRLEEIARPKIDIQSPYDAFETILYHEQMVTQSIHELYALSDEVCDYPLKVLLHWFIEEQVEEEESAREILDHLRFVADSKAHILQIDRDLMSRK